MTYKQKVRSHAFSLLELSIVLVIISFFIAGITKGQKLIKQSAIQATIQEISELKNAYQEFKAIYFERAGDFSSAHSFFDDESDEICGTSSECNGDGDGIIETDAKANSESFRAFQHLYLGDFIDIAYSGKWNEEKSLPKAKIANAYISLINQGGNFSDNYLKLGSYLDYKNHYSSKGILMPKEAHKLDSKFDDGYANSGWIKAVGSYDGEEYSKFCNKSEKYLSYYKENPSCALIFAIE